jgi:hypothetical protein
MKFHTRGQIITVEIVEVVKTVKTSISFSCFRTFACPVEFLPREIPKGYFTGGEAGLIE